MISDHPLYKLPLVYLLNACRNNISNMNFKRDRSRDIISAAPWPQIILREIDQTQCVKKQVKKDLFDQLLDQENSQIIGELALPSAFKLEMVDQNDEHSGCKCSKIGCLKLYCECFAKGRVCNRNCICTSCQNHPANQHNIYHAKQIANYRNPGYFKGVPAFVPGRKCTCKKSSCRKNYCECYRAGVKCGHECQCVDCHNGGSCHRQIRQMPFERHPWIQMEQRTEISSMA